MASKSDFIYRYRVRNWPDYNRALVRRGSLTFWVDEQAVRSWRAATGSGPLGGRPRTDADTAIEARPARSPTKIVIPPRRNARSPPRSGQSTKSREHTVQLMRELGIRRWRDSSGYMRRSLVETAMSRFKVLIGRRLRSRTMAS